MQLTKRVALILVAVLIFLLLAYIALQLFRRSDLTKPQPTASEAVPTNLTSLTFMGTTTQYSLDATHVYYEGNSIPEADPHSFTLLSTVFAKDHYRVYAYGLILPNADPLSITTLSFPPGVTDFDGSYPTTLSDSYLKDSSQVYFCLHVDDDGPETNGDSISCNIIEGADPTTFEPLYEFGGINIVDEYAKDIHHVYFGDNQIKGADPSSFVANGWNGEYEARDKNQTYNGGFACKNVACNATWPY